MASWPEALPKLTDIREQVPDTRIRSEMEVGPAKVRNRYTAAPRIVSGKLTLDGTQRQVFDSFYADDLDRGALPFDYDDPVTDETESFRFLSVGTFELTRGSEHVPYRTWMVDVQLERMA